MNIKKILITTLAAGALATSMSAMDNTKKVDRMTCERMYGDSYEKYDQNYDSVETPRLDEIKKLYKPNEFSG